jgi:GNAT superfamily N-acetyltransferase
MVKRIFNLKPVDAQQIITLGKEFYGMTGLSGTFHGDTFISFWNGFLQHGQAAMWVYVEDSVIVGTIGVTLTMSLFDGKVIADESFWFVAPHHRGTAGVRLFVEMKKWAKEHGAQRILMGKMLYINPENDKVGLFYERQGFMKLQTQYALDI